MDAYFSKDGRMQKDIKAGVREAENEVLSVASSSEDIAIEINDGCQGTLVFNYALQQNGEKLIKNLQIANNTTFDFNGAVIRISFDPDYAYVVEGAVDLPAGEVCEFVPAISFKTSYLLKLTEKQLGMLNIEIIYQGEIVAQKRWPVMNGQALNSAVKRWRRLFCLIILQFLLYLQRRLRCCLTGAKHRLLKAISLVILKGS